MSDRTNYLIDLLHKLDARYQGVYLVRAGCPSMRLMDFGPERFEVVAQALDMERKPELRMHTPLPDVHSVSLRLRENDQDLWDVWLEAGTKTDELAIDEILRDLAETYPQP